MTIWPWWRREQEPFLVSTPWAEAVSTEDGRFPRVPSKHSDHEATEPPATPVALLITITADVDPVLQFLTSGMSRTSTSITRLTTGSDSERTDSGSDMELLLGY